MTKDECAIIQRRCYEVYTQYADGIGIVTAYQIVRDYITDVPALLKALEEVKESLAERCNLYVTAAESYIKMTDDREHWKARAMKAEQTLVYAGYTDHGGELWKPPLGKAPDFDLVDGWCARVEALERAIKDKKGQGHCTACYSCMRRTAPYNECSGCSPGFTKWEFDEARFTGGGE